MMPINVMYRRKELQFMFSYAEVKAVFTNDRAMIEQFQDDLPSLEHIIVLDEPETLKDPSFLGGGTIISESVSVDRGISFTPAPDDSMIIMFTSGTESDPKAVIHTCRTFVPTHLDNAQEYQMTENDTILCLTPLSHMFSLPIVIMALYNGATQVMSEKFSVEGTLDLFEREGITFCIAAPTHLIDILKASESRDIINTKLRLVLTGGNKIPAQMVKNVRQRFNCEIIAQWGMTELGGGSFTRPNDPEHLTWDTVGRACPNGEVRVFDEERNALPVEQVGEIGFRGASLFEGYYNNPAATDAVMIEGGFFLTGDLGWMDSVGYIHYVSRKKDTINRGGLKVHTAEIEEALIMHPKVNQAAVISVPDERLGERGCAIISLREDASFTLAEMTEYLLGLGMAKYKFPEFLEIVSELPMTASGKVIKGVLRNAYANAEIKRSI
jgi:acyl-CoA synthetase (AMP-forming)/AMP-acid ligase II